MYSTDFYGEPDNTCHARYLLAAYNEQSSRGWNNLRKVEDSRVPEREH
jgi:hypothetical protein